MNTHVKAALTLTFLALLVVGGVTWGWSAATSPFPHSAPQKVCNKTTLQPGDRLAAPKVTVSVFNASTRVGLAENTLTAFEDQGFGPGAVGNAPKGTVVHYAQIWSTHPSDPAVQLVLSRLGQGAVVVRKHHAGPGVVVLVGPQFTKLVAGRSSIKVTSRTVVCEPPTG